MMNWGSVPDWLSVLLAFLALLGFVIVERERLILGKRSLNNTSENSGSESDTENGQSRLTENNVDNRAKLYSRILIGIIFGVALSPIFSWASSGLFPTDQYNYDIRNTAETTLTALFSIILSLLLTFIYFRAYRRLASVFVHWAERLAFSYLGFWVILGFSWWRQSSTTDIYYIEPFPITTVLTSVIMFLLIGFPSTPIDWIIYLVGKSREKNNAS